MQYYNAHAQSNEVKLSNHMETEGLSRAIDFSSANSLTIHTLVTDRHKQITKFIGKKHPNIEHRFDVWHVSKGMSDCTYQILIMHAHSTCSYVATYLICIYRTEEEIDKTGQIQRLRHH